MDEDGRDAGSLRPVDVRRWAVADHPDAGRLAHGLERQAKGFGIGLLVAGASGSEYCVDHVEQAELIQDPIEFGDMIRKHGICPAGGGHGPQGFPSDRIQPVAAGSQISVANSTCQILGQSLGDTGATVAAEQRGQKIGPPLIRRAQVGVRPLRIVPGEALLNAGEHGLAVHSVAGLAPDEGTERVAYEDTYRENLAWAADQLAPLSLNLMMEPINGKRDVPGMFLQTTSQARGIMGELGRANLRLQFDVYHVQIMEGDLVQRFTDCLPDIGHVQIANPPDRREPDEGEINFPYLFDAMDAAGYDGWVGCEYKPQAGTRAGLGWGAKYGLTAG